MRDNNNNNTEYQELADKLSDYIKTDDDDGNKRIQAPTVIFVNKRNIVAVYIGIINSDWEEIMTDEKNTLKQNFESLVDKMITFETTTSSENIEEAN